MIGLKAAPPSAGDATVCTPVAGPKRRARLSALGAYGFQKQEPVVLAVLVTGDPLLLIGRSGTGKTFLLNSISEALGLAHRHYNASLDLVRRPRRLPVSGRGAHVGPVPGDARHDLGRGVGAHRRDQPLQAGAPEPALLARARAPDPGTGAAAPPLPVGGDEPVLDEPVLGRGILRRRAAGPGARGSLRRDPRGWRLGRFERGRPPARRGSGGRGGGCRRRRVPEGGAGGVAGAVRGASCATVPRRSSTTSAP